MDIKTLLTSGGAIAASTVVQTVDINQISGALVQLIIGVITLFKLFKKSKNDNQTKDS